MNFDSPLDWSRPIQPFEIQWSKYLQGDSLIEALKNNPDAMATYREGIRAGIERARAAGVPTEAERIDEIADHIINRLNAVPRDGDDPPPHDDKDAPHEGTCADANCPCWQDGFDSGYDTALEDLGIDPDDSGPEVA
jgi:hypothetical protein